MDLVDKIENSQKLIYMVESLPGKKLSIHYFETSSNRGSEKRGFEIVFQEEMIKKVSFIVIT